MQDITGQKFGRLTVTRFWGKRGKNLLWECQCDCGNKKLAQSGNMKAGFTQSCGCLHKERTSQSNSTKHLDRPAKEYKEYRIWKGINERCNNPNHRAFLDYGARGILVCDRWKNGEGSKTGFVCFIEDMGIRPTDNHSIERLNNDDGYNPHNCKWALQGEQSINKRNNKRYEFNGRFLLIGELAKEHGINPQTLKSRLGRGWTLEDALMKPKDNRGSHNWR